MCKAWVTAKIFLHLLLPTTFWSNKFYWYNRTEKVVKLEPDYVSCRGMKNCILNFYSRKRQREKENERIRSSTYSKSAFKTQSKIQFDMFLHGWQTINACLICRLTGYNFCITKGVVVWVFKFEYIMVWIKV